MCGIVGKYDLRSGKVVSEHLIKHMCNTIIHRGPDDEGIFTHENIGLGMRRLSIIDIDSGKQPIFNEEKSKVIVFNGEIYNYKELFQELRDKGHKFQTKSDTETILHAYEEYGEQCLHKLNGMFAFAILDIQKKEIFIARDRIGIKPLYYHFADNQFHFASEIKAILADNEVKRELNNEALDLYLSYMFVPGEHSMFKNIHKLLPGHYLKVNSNGIQDEKYWDIDFSTDNRKTKEQFIEEFNNLFHDSVKKRMISEVPLGAFLSGGIDSSAVVASMAKQSSKPVKTFSIGFKEGGYHDETKYAEQIAKRYNTEHTTFKVDSNVIDLMDMYIHHFDEPFADYAAFPTYVVSKLAKEHVTVVLTGDGGDELFGGYDRYKYELLMQKYKKIPAGIRKFMLHPIYKFGSKITPANSRSRIFADAFVRRNELSFLSSKKTYLENFYKFNQSQKHSLIGSKYNYDISDKFWDNSNNDFLGQRLYYDQKTNLPEDMLTKVDRVSMAVSLEARVPFLDHRIIELAATIPSNMKVQNSTLKYFLKESFSNILPDNILHRPKHGFSSPINKWLRNDLKEYLTDSLSSERIKRISIFDDLQITKMIKEHMSGRKNFGDQLFMILVVQEWANKYKL